MFFGSSKVKGHHLLQGGKRLNDAEIVALYLQRDEKAIAESRNSYRHFWESSRGGFRSKNGARWMRKKEAAAK
jgi:hypothetical protein